MSAFRFPWIAGSVFVFTAIVPSICLAQTSEDFSGWQIEKCEIYRKSWERALDFFGTDNVNYDFIAQNENFVASGCTAPSNVCAKSTQELEIADALTIAMLNAGAASTFLPFRCRDGWARASATLSGPP